MRSNCLPSTLAPHKRIREPYEDIIVEAFEFSDTMSKACHNCCIPEHTCLYILDLEIADLVHASLEYLSEHCGSVGRATVWPRAGPFGRDDALNHGPIAGEVLVHFENTPKAFANFSPGLGAQRQPRGR